MGDRERSPMGKSGKEHRRMLFICNIPFEMDWQALKSIFRDNAKCAGYVKMYKSDGKLNGLATMEMRTSEEALKAIDAMNGYEVRGRKLVVRFETERDKRRLSSMECDDDGRDEEPMRMGVNYDLTPDMLERCGFRGPITDSVYVSNLPYSMDWKALKDRFRKAGKPMNADITTGKDGKSRGFGIVKYSSAFEALLAIAIMDSEMVNGRMIRVRMDTEGKEHPLLKPIFPNTPIGTRAANTFYMEMTRRMSSREPEEARMASNVINMIGRPPMPMMPPMGMYNDHMDRRMDDFRAGPRRSRGFTPPPRHAEDFDRPGLLGAAYRPASRSPPPMRSRKEFEDRRPIPPFDGPRLPPNNMSMPSDAVMKLIQAAIAGGMSRDEVDQYASQLGVDHQDLDRMRMRHSEPEPRGRMNPPYAGPGPEGYRGGAPDRMFMRNRPGGYARQPYD